MVLHVHARGRLRSSFLTAPFWFRVLQNPMPVHGAVEFYRSAAPDLFNVFRWSSWRHRRILMKPSRRNFISVMRFWQFYLFIFFILSESLIHIRLKSVTIIIEPARPVACQHSVACSPPVNCLTAGMKPDDDYMHGPPIRDELNISSVWKVPNPINVFVRT